MRTLLNQNSQVKNKAAKDDEEDDNGSNDEVLDDKSNELDGELYDDDLEPISEDIKKLEKTIIDETLSQKLHQRVSKLHRENLSSLPLYKKKDSKDNSTTVSFSQTPQSNSKYSLFVSVQHKGNELYIQKSTAVWLFSEGERVSTDRLVRVRCNQPFCEKTNKSLTEQSSPTNTINVG